MDSSLNLVIGLGKTGLSIARYLKKRDHSFCIFDTRPNPPGLAIFKEEFPKVQFYFEHLPHELAPNVSEIICSPGVSLEHPDLKYFIEQGVPIIGDIECLARVIKVPVIAITGTNGKSTVTTLVGKMLEAFGLKVAVAGNIGVPVLDILSTHKLYDIWVLELSSFQLELLHSLKPLAASILNITPDHLDRHHHLEAYKAAKQRVYLGAETLLYNREDSATFPQNQIKKSLSFGLDQPKENNWGIIQNEAHFYLAHGSHLLLEVNEMTLKGLHNWRNALAACALAHTAGVTYQTMVDVLKTFQGLPHRTQFIKKIDNVVWINDSKGTNVGATISAVSGIGGSVQGKIVLIAGGQGKGADFTDLRESVTEYVKRSF